ncbi:hypothetical protein HBH53_124580 [Parastagonospora nodorum]|nr:hypothetical protein HBH53_124580 [Parastagonospora nodorum]
MVFNTFIMKVRRTLLCCNDHKQLDIGSPTNVRKVSISSALPNLTDSQRKFLREKASSDTIRLLSIPHTSPPSPTGSHTPTHSTPRTSHEPSSPLLNAASKGLPSILPTPPRHKHADSSPPAARMPGMKHTSRSRSPARRLSFSSASSQTTEHSALFDRLPPRGRESMMTLNLEFAWEAGVETPRTMSLSEGFREVKTVGGAERTAVGQRGVRGEEFGKGGDGASDSEEEFGVGERSPFVKI